MKPLNRKQRLKMSFNERIRHDKKRNPEILKQVKALLDEFHNSLGELADVQADAQLDRLRRVVGRVL